LKLLLRKKFTEKAACSRDYCLLGESFNKGSGSHKDICMFGWIIQCCTNLFIVRFRRIVIIYLLCTGQRRGKEKEKWKSPYNKKWGTRFY